MMSFWVEIDNKLVRFFCIGFFKSIDVEIVAYSNELQHLIIVVKDQECNNKCISYVTIKTLEIEWLSGGRQEGWVKIKHGAMEISR